MHLELGSAVRGVNGCEVDCCHLFAGARQGSTTMLVIDIGSLREVSIFAELSYLSMVVKYNWFLLADKYSEPFATFFLSAFLVVIFYPTM